jgi:electron transfer flavoprotein alpha subunit
MKQIYTYIYHKNGTVDDSALELLSAARQIDARARATAIVAGSGDDLDKVCDGMTSAFDEVWKIDHPEMAYPNAETVRKALAAILPADALVIAAHDTFGMDLGPGLSVKLNSPFVADVAAIEEMDGSVITVVRQVFGGLVSTHVACDTGNGAVITVRPGAFVPDDHKSTDGCVVDKSTDLADLTVGRKYMDLVVAEVGDVDITKSEVLVSIGRGIEDEENIEIAQELAEAMGAVVSCSRPVVDAKWLDKSRQVGTSGQTVKPKVYMACGISGSFQHMGGIKGSPFIVAVNKNAKAPIFQVADVGIVDDILDFMPVLTEKIEAL